MMAWTFGVAVGRQGRDWVAGVRDLPEVTTSDDSLADALRGAADAIEMSIVFRMKKGDHLPTPSVVLDGEHAVPISAQIAAKASVYAAWRASGLNEAELAHRMGRAEADVRRILNPTHGTKIEQLEQAAKALGGRLTISYANT